MYGKAVFSNTRREITQTEIYSGSPKAFQLIVYGARIGMVHLTACNIIGHLFETCIAAVLDSGTRAYFNDQFCLSCHILVANVTSYVSLNDTKYGK